MLDRDAILALAQADLPREEVELPGGSCYVKTMSGSERDRFEASHLADPKNNLRARLAAYTVCDAEGRPLFTEADVPALGQIDAAILDRIVPVALRLNKMGAQDVAALEGNSAAIPSGSSPSASP